LKNRIGGFPMAHPIKMITYQDLHKLNHSVKQLENWHERFKQIKEDSPKPTISDAFFYEHEKIVNDLNDEAKKLKRKKKLKYFVI
jgi:hypothetical protein